jgi:hypothetical protein
VLKSSSCGRRETAILPLCASLRCHHSLANMPMFRSPSSSSVLPIFYPNMYERDQVQEVDPEAQATGSTSLTMHPGILLGLSEYYCKAPRVVLRAYLVSVFLVRGGRRTIPCSVVRWLRSIRHPSRANLCPAPCWVVTDTLCLFIICATRPPPPAPWGTWAWRRWTRCTAWTRGSAG